VVEGVVFWVFFELRPDSVRKRVELALWPKS
jgi:hypothetical protein